MLMPKPKLKPLLLLLLLLLMLLLLLLLLLLRLLLLPFRHLRQAGFKQATHTLLYVSSMHMHIRVAVTSEILAIAPAAHFVVTSVVTAGAIVAACACVRACTGGTIVTAALLLLVMVVAAIQPTRPLHADNDRLNLPLALCLLLPRQPLPPAPSRFGYYLLAITGTLHSGMLLL
jgi:hypothetical protein